jgi:predicted nucleic acid-binding protein
VPSIGYLLDTNAVQDWYNEQPKVVARIRALPPETNVVISAITVGEFAFGANLFLRGRDHDALGEFERWQRRIFVPGRVLNITPHTGEVYGQIKARLRETFHLPDEENNPEKWYSPTVADVLRVEENDIWIAAHAVERGLILVTRDKMEEVRKAAEALPIAPLLYENWAI